MDQTDINFLRCTIDLAERGRGSTSPNPLVGAIVAKNGVVLGEGWHAEYGGSHAERAALVACEGADTVGATMYVSLEPCCHHGQTPPCTDAIIAAGIKRVVIGSDDPSDKVSGKGIDILRGCGIDVDVASGEVARAARWINQPFRKYSRTGRPWVLYKWAMTLDGQTATATGDSKWISSEQARRYVHQWRSEFDAIAVGIGTALHDDPTLTARVDDANHPRQPTRIVFDSSGRLPLQSKLLTTISQAPVILITSSSSSASVRKAFENAGAKVIIADGADSAERVQVSLDLLGEIGVTSLLLEGGAHLAGAFQDAGQIDEIRTFIAPTIIGSNAVSPIAGQGARRIEDASRAISCESESIGGDVYIRAMLREW